ncbi:3629_t:CDS:2 [Scutellospora calospora]|uniref:3629_t:CDS:1 n=1 Tax=Scutellospora calospora TaxID=85575 RepID=A0ACA9K8F7_9GLOM|nr:3629_t:CDS:2 [Scutellospora calospora]
MDLNSIFETINSVEKGDDNDGFYDNLYEILGCTSSCTTEQISAEYKKRALNCHPDKVKKDENTEKQFYQLSTAYTILTDDVERSQYDKWRSSSIKIPYKMWKDLVIKKGHTIHWKSPPKQPLKITDSSSTELSSNNINHNISSRTTYKGKKCRQNDLYEKFRNYEI